MPCWNDASPAAMKFCSDLARIATSMFFIVVSICGGAWANAIGAMSAHAHPTANVRILTVAKTRNARCMSFPGRGGDDTSGRTQGLDPHRCSGIPANLLSLREADDVLRGGGAAVGPERGEKPGQNRRIDRLHDVIVEAGLLRLEAVLLLAIAGDRDDERTPVLGFRADALGDLVAVDLRQPDIEQNGVGTQA